MDWYFDCACSIATKPRSNEARVMVRERVIASIWDCTLEVWVVIELCAAATKPLVPVNAVIKLLILVAIPICAEDVVNAALLFRFKSASTLLGLLASAASSFVESVIDNTPEESKPRPIFEALSKVESMPVPETLE